MGSKRKRTTHVLFVDDHDMVRDAVDRALATFDDIHVVASVASLAEAVDALATEGANVDVIVTDLRLGDGLGTELVAHAHALDPVPPVLLLTGSDDRAGVRDALGSGCAGFVSKTRDMDYLAEAIRQVAGGASVFPAALLSDVLTLGSEVAAALSPRERQVLSRLAQARTCREIADDLFISQYTVRNHIRQILTKLGVRSQLEAVVVAARAGLVTLT